MRNRADVSTRRRDMAPVTNPHATERNPARRPICALSTGGADVVGEPRAEGAERTLPSMQHQPNRRTVTTVGLPARKEQLIKSMLLAVGAQTVDAWSFIDETEADVAICDVDSTLASVTAARARQSGRPHCVWLAPADGPRAPTVAGSTIRSGRRR